MVDYKHFQNAMLTPFAQDTSTKGKHKVTWKIYYSSRITLLSLQKLITARLNSIDSIASDNTKNSERLERQAHLWNRVCVVWWFCTVFSAVQREIIDSTHVLNNLRIHRARKFIICTAGQKQSKYNLTEATQLSKHRYTDITMIMVGVVVVKSPSIHPHKQRKRWEEVKWTPEIKEEISAHQTISDTSTIKCIYKTNNCQQWKQNVEESLQL